MLTEAFVRQSLQLHNIPIFESDISYIQQVLQTIHQAQAPVYMWPELNQEIPIVIVDKELIRHD